MSSCKCFANGMQHRRTESRGARRFIVDQILLDAASCRPLTPPTDVDTEVQVPPPTPQNPSLSSGGFRRFSIGVERVGARNYPQQCLNFLPEPQGQGSFRPTGSTLP